MEALARQLAKKRVAWAVVIAVLLLAALSIPQAMRVERDDNLLAFLPQDNPEVAAFYEINKRFGGLDVAVVGIETDDPFDAKFLQALKTTTKALNDNPSVSYALSLSNFEHFTANEEHGGIDTDALVNTLPTNDAEKDELKKRVMSLDHVVGQVIAADEKSVIIYGFLSPEADPRQTANFIRDTVNEGFPEAEFPKQRKYWGGAPFISTYIYDVTQADMKRLIPWAVIVILVIVMLSFRDFIGSLLALGSTGLGILFAHGLMGLMGTNANIVLSSMPVILFAVGSAYGIHVLVRYYALRRTHSCEDALVATMQQIGTTVLAAGLTTVAGLMSFLAMDIAPMREFGLFTGLGILATLVLSLTFIPAVVRLTELKSRVLPESMFQRSLVGLVTFAQKNRIAVGGGLAVLAVAGIALAGRVEARMETRAFFEEGSPPDRSETFLRDNFGGSQFIQVLVEGDMTDPEVLREVQRVGDAVALEDDVSSVTHIGQVVGLVYEAWVGERRVPPERAQVLSVYAMLQGRSAIKQLVTEDLETGERRQALIHIKVKSDRFDQVEALLAKVEGYVADSALRTYRVVVTRDETPPVTKPTRPPPAPPADDEFDIDGTPAELPLDGGVVDGAAQDAGAQDAGEPDDQFGDLEGGGDEFADVEATHGAPEGEFADADRNDEFADVAKKDEFGAPDDQGEFGDAAKKDEFADVGDAVPADAGTAGEFADVAPVTPPPVVPVDAAPGPAEPLSEADRQAAKDRLSASVTLTVLARLHAARIDVNETARAALAAHLTDRVQGATGKVHERVLRFLASKESIFEGKLRPRANKERWSARVATAVVSLGEKPSAETLANAAAGVVGSDDPALPGLIAKSLRAPLDEAWRQAASSERSSQLLAHMGVAVPEGAAGARLHKAVADALLDLEATRVLIDGGPSKLDYAVSGVPVLYRGLSKSVTANQFNSLGLALALVLVIMVGLFRSLSSGALAAAPTVVTLLVVYGLMGAMGMHLDIGTSMLASIIVGAGVDYAVHLLAAWRAEEGEDLTDAARSAAQRAGPAIWTNALMVAAGFFVLTLGQARPLKNVGSLTAAAMVAAGLATFLVLPILARKRRYR